MKRLQFIFIVSLLLLSVSNAQAESEEIYSERKLPASDQIKILTVNPVRMDPKDFKTFSDKEEEKECKKWKLTKAQILCFFSLSIHALMSNILRQSVILWEN